MLRLSTRGLSWKWGFATTLRKHLRPRYGFRLELNYLRDVGGGDSVSAMYIVSLMKNL